jgi:hypothetical protein
MTEFPKMTEPASTAAGGFALYKLGVVFGFSAILAAIVVMAMTLPKSPREFGVALICTVMSGVTGGAFVIRWFEWQHWAGDYVGLVAIGGVAFVCSLPGWVIVRAWFAYAEASRGRSLLDMVRELKEAAGK